MISAVVDKRFVDKIGDKTAILWKCDMLTKILFCRHKIVLFWKRKHTFKKQNIDKISLQKGLTVSEKCAVKWVQWHAWRSARHRLPGQSRWSITRLEVWILVGTSLHLFPDHCFVNNCRRRDEIWPDMATKKSVLDDSTNNDAMGIFVRAVLPL